MENEMKQTSNKAYFKYGVCKKESGMAVFDYHSIFNNYLNWQKYYQLEEYSLLLCLVYLK